MNLVRQEHPEGCAVAVFAMLTDRTYAEAAERLARYKLPVRYGVLRVELEYEGFFCRSIRDRELTGGVWPPPPFAPLHFADVTQPSGNGHCVAVAQDGSVLDPLCDEPRRLDEWEVCHELVGLIGPGCL